jgi:hypothetical protein
MHTVEAMDDAVATAQRLGFHIRFDYLGGHGGGDCEIRGQKWIILDLAASPSDQLAQLLDAIQREANASVLPLPLKPSLEQLLSQRRSA